MTIHIQKGTFCPRSSDSFYVTNGSLIIGHTVVRIFVMYPG